MPTPLPDSRAIVADIATDIEAAAMRAHEALNGAHPYSMSSPQFKLAGWPPDRSPRPPDA